MAESDAQVFDPLAVENIGVILAVELIQQPLRVIPAAGEFEGAGVYALYYQGQHPAYRELLELEGAEGRHPLYIGKAIRRNAKQGFNPRPTTDKAIFKRLTNHAESIAETDLKVEDFRCRYLVINDAYIGLAESVLITLFRPPWNGMGFGNKVVGKFREEGKASLWDSLHPGRGGRPAGTERQEDALKKIRKSVAQLKKQPTDPQMRWMLERIKRFL